MLHTSLYKHQLVWQLGSEAVLLTTSELRMLSPSNTMPRRIPSSSCVSPWGPGTKMSSSQKQRSPGHQLCTSPVSTSRRVNSCSTPPNSQVGCLLVSTSAACQQTFLTAHRVRLSTASSAALQQFSDMISLQYVICCECQSLVFLLCACSFTSYQHWNFSGFLARQPGAVLSQRRSN